MGRQSCDRDSNHRALRRAGSTITFPWMRATARIVQLAHARWTPCVALVLFSLLFVALAIVVIPDRLGPIGPEAQDRRTFTPHSAVASEPFQTDTASTGQARSPSPGSPPLGPAASPRSNGINNAVVGSLFGSTPPIELPVAPPDPAPPPPPAQVPPPAPTPSIFELPAPPPQPVAPAQTADPAHPPPIAAPVLNQPPASEPESGAAPGQQQP